METFELRYFLGVAAQENIHQASKKLHVSPGSLSKAITRLEGELSLKLFSRDGRNIKLTSHGRLLQKRASEIIRLEESAKLELVGHLGTINIVIAGAEILLSQMGQTLTQKIKKDYPLAHFEYVATDDESALEKALRGEAHIAIVSADVPAKLELASKIIGEAHFETFVGTNHPLYGFAKSGKPISIQEVLKYGFVSPNNPILGKVGLKQSLDGWRDDQFPRKIEYLTSSLKTMEQILIDGKAIAYLPDYFGKSLAVLPLKINGCPYTCHQKIKIVTRDPKETRWMGKLFG